MSWNNIIPWEVLDNKPKESMKINPILAIDFYKSGHYKQYPKGTTKVYSNFTPRSSKLASKAPEVWDDKMVFFGLQGFIKWFLVDCFNDNFFNQPKEKVIDEYKRIMDGCLGPGAVGTDHISALHDLGYLPLSIKALPEGSYVDCRVPLFIITNTNPNFYWLVNYIESVMSSEVWKGCTTASTAFQYRKLLTKYAKITGAPLDFVPWQGHDFSFRGLSGVHDASSSGAGHLLSFLGTDTIPAILYLEDYYKGKETFVGGSVAATEHSVMCMGGKDGEYQTFKRLITEIYPAGIVSIVSDTWNFWNVITNTAKSLKTEILNREGKVVFRPDSGDPVKIVCGDPDSKDPVVRAGAIEVLWNVFGGTTNAAGFRELNPHVGLIYGDSIDLDRAAKILKGLADKKFASSNIVFGIGSYTYQYQTRDSYGFAIKATYGEVDGKPTEIFKDPITDEGTKKSLKGLIRVELENGKYVVYDQQTPEQEGEGLLQVVFCNGAYNYYNSLSEMRIRLQANL
jgi:nicotinamide phosphoribosyltransferase